MRKGRENTRQELTSKHSRAITEFLCIFILKAKRNKRNSWSKFYVDGNIIVSRWWLSNNIHAYLHKTWVWNMSKSRLENENDKFVWHFWIIKLELNMMKQLSGSGLLRTCLQSEAGVKIWLAIKRKWGNVWIGGWKFRTGKKERRGD